MLLRDRSVPFTVVVAVVGSGLFVVVVDKNPIDRENSRTSFVCGSV